MNQLKNHLNLNDAGIQNVTLTHDFLVNAERIDIEFILGLNQIGYAPQQKLDPYRFLAHFYTTAELERPEQAAVYEDSWERSKDNNFRGHMFGHYMSALALAYAGAKDEQLKEQLAVKMTICVTELKKCQDAFSEKYPERAGYIAPFGDIRLDAIDGLTGGVGKPLSGTVFVPWYNLHKVLAGLLDIYKHARDLDFAELALTIAKGFGDYFYNVRASQYETENKEKMLATEYGGMNDAFYELYNLTGEAKYRICAEMFDEVSLFNELAAGNNILPGKHANTQVPKFIGALKRYTTLMQNEKYYNDLTPEAKQELPKYLVAVENFFDIVLENHSYITGGNSCDEHFHAPDTLASTIHKDATHETCNVHNMLKIARDLFKLTGDKKYADYYENAFVNAILSAQNPETGEMMYFQPMGSGYYKLFRHGLFWCCTGTGIESYVKLGDSIYFTDREKVYVNMYFSSEFAYVERNLTLIQTADLLEGSSVKFKVFPLVDASKITENDYLDLYLRIPDWHVGAVKLCLNGSLENGLDLIDESGYLVIEDVSLGDEVELTFNKEIKADALKDNPHIMAFRYGPVVLSAGLGDNDLDATNPNGIMVLVPQRDPNSPDMIRITNGQSVDEWKENVKGQFGMALSDEFCFKPHGTDMEETLIYTPHYKKYKERYALYMTFVDPETEAAIGKARLEEKKALLEKEGASAFLTNFDNHAYEAEYNLQQNNSATGSWPWHGKSLRFGHEKDSWFSYDLPIVRDVPNFLNTTLFRHEAGREWAIYVNGEHIGNEIVTKDGMLENENFYTSTIAIPDVFSTGDAVRVNEAGVAYITVRFESTGGPVGAIFGISITQQMDKRK